MKELQLSKLQLLVVATLVVLTIQGWTGDFVNLFAVFPIGAVNSSLGGLLQALQGAGQLPMYHAFEGAILVAFSVVVLIFSFQSKIRNAKIASIIALAAVVSATIGGVLFVLSGFHDNGNSMQMAGSFIGAYALYFLELYVTKANKTHAGKELK
jgi:amino acid permease